MARGEVGAMTVPAFNLRGMTEELSQGIFEAAIESKTGAFILEIARSEMGYTAQPPLEFVRRVLIGADRAGWKGPIFFQGDHSQLKAQSPGRMAEGEVERIKKLIDVEIEAGFYNIDIDASTLVDVSLSSVREQQLPNATVTAELATYIRTRQPQGITISIGGEIGHIGERNSTADDLSEFDSLFKSKFDNKLAGLSKISVQTGSSHGGQMLADGSMKEMVIDFEVIRTLSQQIKQRGMAGVVQHGASTLPLSLFSKFPENGAIEIHLSTGWQNMIMDHPEFPAGLREEIYRWLDTEMQALRKEGENERQFHYRCRKLAWGPMKDKFDQLPQTFKTTIKEEMKKRCLKLYETLKVAGSQEQVKRYLGWTEGEGEVEKNLRVIEQADVVGKSIVVRVDWNVTLGKAMQIVDDTRIVRTLPTISWLIEKGAARIVLISHLGKPEGRDSKYSIKPVAEYASKLLGQPITVAEEIEQAKASKDKIVMLENIRYFSGEEENGEELAKELAALGEIYVNEAFGESHRKCASIVGITKFLPSYAGMWLQDEVETVMKVRSNPERPYIVVMGGAKVEDKINLIEVLSQSADMILLGGKLANEYVQKGMKVSGRAEIITPLEGSALLDIGEHTRAKYSEILSRAKTIVWNGPMGKVEDTAYQAGTQAIYEAIYKNEEAYTLVGGGDTLASIGKEEHLNRIDHVSTGGGAMLKLLEEGKLVGVEALK
jgi:3-phosphoglycerate kinase